MTSREASTDGDTLRRLESSAQSVSVGGIGVRRARAELREDEDGSMYFLVSLDLTPPAAGQKSWPIEEFHDFRVEAQDRLDAEGAPLGVRVAYVGGSPEMSPDARG